MTKIVKPLPRNPLLAKAFLLDDTKVPIHIVMRHFSVKHLPQKYREDMANKLTH